MVHVGVVDNRLKFADPGRQGRGRCAINQKIIIEPVLDEIGNGADFEPVLLSKLHEIRLARHRAIVLHDFTNDPRWFETGKAWLDPRNPRFDPLEPKRRRSVRAMERCTG